MGISNLGNLRRLQDQVFHQNREKNRKETLRKFRIADPNSLAARKCFIQKMWISTICGEIVPRQENVDDFFSFGSFSRKKNKQFCFE